MSNEKIITKDTLSIFYKQLQGKVDAELSSTSTNPIQNKAVKEAIDNIKTDSVDIDNSLSETSENPVQNKVITSALNDIKTSIPEKISIDSELSDTSENPVQNKVVKARLDEVFQSVSNGKSRIASAITDKGVQTDATATFQTMENNIRSINTGGKFYGGVVEEIYFPFRDHVSIDSGGAAEDYKFEITKIRNNDPYVQLSEFKFISDNDIEITPIEIEGSIEDISPTGSGEGVDKLFDNSTSTKLCARHRLSEQPSISAKIYINILTINKIIGYCYYTANDSQNRDPVSWNLYKKINEEWVLIDSRQEVSTDIPTARQTRTNIFYLEGI